MNLKIDQNNLHLLLPGKLGRMAQMYINDNHVGPVEALRKLYRSPIYSQLEREDTKLWEYGPVALYQMAQERGL